MKTAFFGAIVMQLLVGNILYGQKEFKFKLSNDIKITSLSYWVSVDDGDDKLVSLAINEKASEEIISFFAKANIVHRGSVKIHGSAVTSKFGRRVVTFVNSLGVPGAVTVEGCFLIDSQGRIFEPLDLGKPDMLLERLDEIIAKN